MKSWNSTEFWAEYSNFKVGPESGKYKISFSSSYSKSHSTIGNSMSVANGQLFSARDANNDECSNRNFNCAAHYNGWWFSCCSNIFPNGQFFNYPTALSAPDWKGIVWRYGFGPAYSLMEIEILIA
ncbi:hypothetical protein BOX15_Mlig024605g1 [Macrostomum lignano]|uniref:Fibrinogen C-terminal domain-containing protein n=1 Tax=Macrostomum lignano TaxID=282301 RepID=A0A267EFR2_9PLAT|nr:hypothetical protein BOX15_Mlig024605g1 [Macrostomum lignano]